MAAKPYFEKLKDVRWQKKRLERLEKSHWCCDTCGDTASTLHVHHKAYFKGREPWEYDVDQLSSLCESCHRDTHESEDPLQVAASYVDLAGPISRESAASLVEGFCFSQWDRTPDSEAYLWGEIARIASLALGKDRRLSAPELIGVIDRIREQPTDFWNALRAFAGLTYTEPERFQG